MLRRCAVFAAILLLASPALADERGAPPPQPCEPPADWKEVVAWRNWMDHSKRDDQAKWVEESKRLTGRADAWRHLDRLFLAVDGGRVVTLADCLFSDGGRLFLYERADDVGRFHIARVHYYEDLTYLLIMRTTGLTFEIRGLPIWSPDKARFAYADCDMMNGRQEVVVMRPTGDDFIVEARTSLPCGMAGCGLSWDGASALDVVCEKAGESYDQRRTLRMERRDERWFIPIPARR